MTILMRLADGNDDHDNHVKTKPNQAEPSKAKPKPKPKLKLKPEPKKRASHGWTCLGHNKNTKQCSCLELQQQQPHLGQCNQDGNKYGQQLRQQQQPQQHQDATEQGVGTAAGGKGARGLLTINL